MNRKEAAKAFAQVLDFAFRFHPNQNFRNIYITTGIGALVEDNLTQIFIYVDSSRGPIKMFVNDFYEVAMVTFRNLGYRVEIIDHESEVITA